MSARAPKDLVITAKTKGLKDEGWRYVYEGDLISETGIKIELDKGLYVTGSVSAASGYSIKAGVCTWRETEEADRTITCGKLESGKVEYGVLKEVGLPKEEKSEPEQTEEEKVAGRITLEGKTYRLVEEPDKSKK